ncbi:xylose isomerase-like protein, partial [Rhodotorula sp. JG-1b]
PTQLLPPLGIATLSLGSCEHHALADKIRAAAEAGFSSVELFDLDWEHYRDSYARSNGYALPCEEGDAASRAAAHELAKVCRDEGVEISCYQPLRNFEGWLDPEQEQKARKHAKGILDVMPILGTDLVLCCSNAAPSTETTGSLEKAAADLGWLADLAATYNPPIRVMYEALSFATHRSQWQQAWQVVEYANRPNLGLCLDSFNALARDWADPYSPSGRRSDDVDAQLERSMNELVQRVPGDKIFLYQVADAAFMSPPMTPPTDPSVPRLRPWSRSHRLFPLERSLGAYLPVDRFSDAVIATGYSGPWSLEVFNDSLNDEGKLVPQQHAERGIKGLRLAATQT